MPEHVRDFLDPKIDALAWSVLEPEADLLHRTLVRHGGMMLSAVGGERLSNSDDGQRWRFHLGDGHSAVMEIMDPERVIPAMLRYGDRGLFHAYVGGEDGESRWRPDTNLTYVAEDVNTGNPEPDSMVSVTEALYLAMNVPRRAGWLASSAMAPIRDRIARSRWDPSTGRTKDEIWAHYDLSQDVYVGPHGFLGKLAQYSSGLLPPGHEFASLDDLQEHKVASLARKLELETAGTLLEIGSGWGGLAVALAERAPDLQITSLTVSEEQLKRARERAEAAGVSDRVRFIGQDYREFESDEPFDRIVSVEMIEAVDWRDLGDYFDALDRFADPENGIIVLQSINIRPQQFAHQRHSRNFANTAIFPGGILIPKQEIVDQMGERGRRKYEETELTRSYALTLREWMRNLHAGKAALTGKWLEEGTAPEKIERFYKGFTFYLAGCQTVFRPGTDHLQDWQLTFQPA